MMQSVGKLVRVRNRGQQITVNKPQALSLSVWTVRRSYCSSNEPTEDFAEETFESKPSSTSEPYEDTLYPPMTPQEVVGELDRHIVGQLEAKKAVALAFRNRWRMNRLSADIREMVIPKNILMIGPTGVGKTEIARRLAKLQQAPFIKVEATKYTEVGYVGRDVDHIIRDLVSAARNQIKDEMAQKNQAEIKRRVDDILLELLVGPGPKEAWKEQLASGSLESQEVEIDRPTIPASNRNEGAGGTTSTPNDFMFVLMDVMPGLKKTRKFKTTVALARPILMQQEAEKLMSPELINERAVRAAEHGVVFIDEIDKICNPNEAVLYGRGASSEGVQRDLLPLIEGTIVTTPLGKVDTAKVLFIASGSFYSCKPSDLLPELQGRLPIRVQLNRLKEEDLYRILTEPEGNLIRQQVELLKTEGITLNFKDDAIREIARVAAEVNDTVENIGARRLHTVLERVIEDVSFHCHLYSGKEFVVDGDYVRGHIGDMLLKSDLSRFIL